MIYIPDVVGSSKSITASLGLVYDAYEKNMLSNDKKVICLFGNFILNEKVKKEFKELGIISVYNIKDISSNNIVILNSYGVNKKVYDYLNKNNIEYYDGTSKSILKVQKEIESKYKDNYEIIFVGNYNDIELINLNSYCNNEGLFISREEEFVKLSNKKSKYIVCSSNYDKDKFNNIYKVIKNNYECDIEKYEIKNDFDLILKESIKVSNKCDLMIVIGDKIEETNILLRNCSNSMHFNDINVFLNYILNNDLPEDIGITGGVNTPIKEIYNYKYLLSFVIFYKKRLSELINNQIDVNSKLVSDNDNEIVKDVLKDIADLNKDGKYIRGTLISLGEYLSNSNNNNYLDLALAYELFQTSVLIHDDIIDNARVRRGKETIPRRICRKFLNRINDKDYQIDTLKYANSIAICSGDLGFYEANKIIVEKYNNNKYLSKLLSVYNDIVINTIKGEVIDVTLPFKNKYGYYRSKEKDIIDVYHNKTSLYTIVGPVMLGYALNGKDIDDKLYSVLDKIGLSYQIKDDILSIFNDNIGKSNKSDIEEFKQTIMYIHVISTSYKEAFLNIYGKNNVDDYDLDRIRDILYRSGSYEYANDYLNNILMEINDEIEDLDIPVDCKDLLKGLLLFIDLREK